MNLDDSLYGPQRDIRQTAHAKEQKAIQILTKTLGCTRSQAAQLVQNQQNQEARDRAPKNPNEGSHATPLFQDLPRIQRTESPVEVQRSVVRVVPQMPAVPPAFIPEPEFIDPGADGVYVLKWDSGELTQVKLDEIEVADCSSGTTVTRKFLALPV